MFIPGSTFTQEANVTSNIAATIQSGINLVAFSSLIFFL
jgi:hypothetical protein